MKPKVSVIMGIYNCNETLSEAIESIILQTYANWELIMCDDGSTDNTYNVAKSYAELYPEKIILLRNSTNKMLAETLNHCLRYATGDYIARMDADDISIATRFEKQVSFLKKNLSYDLVGTHMISFDEMGDIGIQVRDKKPTKYDLRFGTPFCHATIMCRKNVYETLNGYRISKEIRRCEDVDLWFRFYSAGFSGYNLQLPLYKVRENKNAFQRRNFSHGIDAMKVCMNGFKLLNYPKKYYLYLLKPLVSSLIPPSFMKLYHKLKDRKALGGI